MNLSQAYQQWEETTKQQGVQEGVQLERRQVVENLLRFRFGSIDEELLRVSNFSYFKPCQYINHQSLKDISDYKIALQK
jgi:hypothetical protein